MSAYPSGLLAAAGDFIAQASARGITVSTAESCTGGLVAALLTEIAGSSAVVECGFVTYSNAAKTRMVGVPAPLIEAHGAVSEEVARAMAEGALAHSGASFAVAITGVAGPGGGSAEKPVGLVHFACASAWSATVHLEQRFGEIGRDAVRMRSVETALSLLVEALDGQAERDPSP